MGLADGISASLVAPLSFPLREHTDAVAARLRQFQLFALGVAADAGEMKPSASAVASGAASVLLAHPWVSWVTSCERF